MTDEQITQAQKLRGDGMTYKAIGAALGVSYGTISYNLDPARRKYCADWYKANLKHVREYKRKYHKAHKNDETYWEHRRFIAAEYYKANREKEHLRGVEYRKMHPVKRAATKAKYYKEHLAEYAAQRALKRGAIIGATVTQLAEIREIYRRAKEDPKVRCYLCGKLIPIGHRHVDHIIPASKGGAHRPSNLAVACDECNLKKSAKLPEEIGLLV